MNDSTPRPTPRARHDGLTAFALAAGLALGHIVAAMSEFGPATAVTPFAAAVFALAASASTLCALGNLAESRERMAARRRIGGWAFALGIGFVGALAPGLL